MPTNFKVRTKMDSSQIQLTKSLSLKKSQDKIISLSSLRKSQKLKPRRKNRSNLIPHKETHKREAITTDKETRKTLEARNKGLSMNGDQNNNDYNA